MPNIGIFSLNLIRITYVTAEAQKMLRIYVLAVLPFSKDNVTGKISDTDGCVCVFDKLINCSFIETGLNYSHNYLL